MNIFRSSGAHRLALALLVAAASAGAAAQFSPLMRYNALVESAFLLDRCGELTADRRAYLRGLTDNAKRPLAYTAEQWATQDAKLAQELERLYPSVSKVRCAELVRNIDQEMKNAPKN